MKNLVLGLLAVALSLVPCRVMAATTLGSLTLTAVKCRIFTPNGDGYNDKVRFEFDNPEQLPIGGTVYALNGARVANLQPGTSTNYTDVMLWDGKDMDGRVVAGGIYIYEIDFQGKHATGTVIVAR
jgi:hypothetical protein